MNKVLCPICNNEPNHFFRREGVLYSQCSSCKTVWTNALDQNGKVGGEFEQERNEKENHLRKERIGELVIGRAISNVKVLDFGCGNGLLVEYLKQNGYENTDGYDAYNETFLRRPKKDYYDIIVMVETAEHFAPNYTEFDLAYNSLVDGGYIIVETSFTNVAEEEGIPVDEFFYVSPSAGHSTFYSHHGLDVLMCLKGFTPRQHYNRHVRVYQKIIK